MPPKKSLLAQIYPSYLLITLLALAGATAFATRSFRAFYQQQTIDALRVRAQFAASQIEPLLDAADFPAIDRYCKRIGPATNTRLTVILPSGKVLADSQENPADMESHADRPEILRAFAGQTGQDTRYSQTLKQHMTYVAVPLGPLDRPLAAIRTALPRADLQHAFAPIKTQLLFAGLAIALAAAALSFLVARRLARSIHDMKHAAQQFARGDFSHHLNPPSSRELAELAHAINSMADQLNDRIQTVTRQKNEHQAILASMAEGVLAVDAAGRIISLNHAATDMLALDPDHARGRAIEEAFRNLDLQQFVHQTLAGSQPIETDVALANTASATRYLRLHGAPLHPPTDSNTGTGGAVIVLHDVTQLRKLENIRRGFVANASHELKTPVTTIKGFVETLLAGAVDDPQQARRFLSIIQKQSDRLTALIEDIVNLTRIEEEHEKGNVPLESHDLCPILAESIELCRVRADQKNITIQLDCPHDLTARVNPDLLEQALVNLVDNAIKYSPENAPIVITVSRTDHTVAIAVADHGPGIESQHLDRIFERFYVVDEARSRKLGGTGLGLAIVKHVAHAHHGAVAVNSRPNHGATFTLSLPA